ncbi:hypothetical protein KSP39_PZI021892 [Platanthera zijinensis]|uniref:Uncharacterized protein n=1 Tax=Platanthera zijinensis TaxID=2320716 RepID=A0AAP0AYV2_9ASPA
MITRLFLKGGIYGIFFGIWHLPCHCLGCSVGTSMSFLFNLCWMVDCGDLVGSWRPFSFLWHIANILTWDSQAIKKFGRTVG